MQRPLMARHPVQWPQTECRRLPQPVEREGVVVGLLADFLVAALEDALQYALYVDGGKPVPPGPKGAIRMRN